MSVQERVNNFVEQVASGQLPFDQVRRQLELEGLKEHEISTIVREVDSEVQSRMLTQTKRSGIDQMIFVGVFLTLFGLVITVGSFTGLFTPGIGIIIIAYGPLLGGLVILFAGIRRKNRKNINKEFTPRIRRKRDNLSS